MPNVGDITTECKPARRDRFTLNYIEAHEDPEDGVLLIKLRGLEPKGGLRPIGINHHELCNLSCKLGKGRNRGGYVYEPASVFYKPPGVNLCI